MTEAASTEAQIEKSSPLKTTGWVCLTIFLLIFFTLIKLPDDRIARYVDSSLNSLLAASEIKITPSESHLTFLTGINYTMKDVTVSFPPPKSSIHLDQIRFSPSLFAMMTKKNAGTLQIDNQGGSISASFSQKGDALSLSFSASKMDLGKAGVIPVFLGTNGDGILDGSGSFAGKLGQPDSLSGKLDTTLKNFSIGSQTIMGFAVPKITLSNSTIQFSVNQGKVQIKTLQIGKEGTASDDIQATISGDVTLGKRLDSSTLNLKIKFLLSDSLSKSFVLLDAVLGGVKLPDQSYSMTLTGPITSPVPAPIVP